jgi:hypothetical protein
MAFSEEYRQKAIEFCKIYGSYKQVFISLRKDYPDIGHPDATTIRRWKEKNKAEGTAQGKTPTKGFDPTTRTIPNRKIENHFDQLVEVAKTLLSGDLDSIRQVNQNRYEYVSREYYPPLLATRRLTKKELIMILKSNLNYANQLYRKMDLLDCFKAHLLTENPQIKDLNRTIEIDPLEFVNILKTVCMRGQIKGICLACEDW